MDFRELTYITAVADERSVTEAAKKLYISQPSLSYIISKVEEDLGVKLFDRKTSPISLTYAGEKYVQTAREILRMRDGMRREMNDIGQGGKGRINIGIPTERAGYMLPKVIPVFRRDHPGVEIRLQESRSEEIIRNLMMDKIGFAVLPGEKDDLPPGVIAEYIYSEKIFLIAGPGLIPPDMILEEGRGASDQGGSDSGTQDFGRGGSDGIAQGSGNDGPGDSASRSKNAWDALPLVDLKKMRKTTPFIMQKEGQFIRKKTDAIFRRLGFFPREVIEVSSTLTAAQLAEIGMGITFVSSRSIDALGGAEKFHCYRYQEKQDSWPVSAIYKKDTYLDNAERAFIDAMKEVFRDESEPEV